MANDDYFVIAYRILRTLRAAMRVEDFDITQISADMLGIETMYWQQIIIMLYENGYIQGISLVPVLGQRNPGLRIGNIRITEKGLMYLEENSMMRKAADFLKGIKDIIPGM